MVWRKPLVVLRKLLVLSRKLLVLWSKIFGVFGGNAALVASSLQVGGGVFEGFGGDRSVSRKSLLLWPVRAVHFISEPPR